MDKAILKKFAIESRQDLMQKIDNKIKTFYVEEDFSKEQKGDLFILTNEKHSLSLTNEEYKKRELLIKRINELGIEQVIEEASYTWFNRIIAIRYMEIHDYLPLTKDNQSLGIRVLSSKDNTPDPEILKFTNLMNQELDIDFKKEKYVELKDDNEKFKYVLLLVCKKLGRVIPQVFDGVTDYIDILIPDNLLNDTGFITKVITEVPEDNYNQVEIIGWLYQYYNQTEKDRVMAKKKTYKKEEVPYVTQLFTPDWVVKYMVENTVIRFFEEYCDLKQWRYYIPINNSNPCNIKKYDLEKFSFIDPCCGSGHILIYAFEVLYQIYIKFGYNKNDIVPMILKNNIYGLDIDERAEQLSVLSVLLKAREYDRNIFNYSISSNINIMSVKESNNIHFENSYAPDSVKIELKKLLSKYIDSKAIGSLLKNKYINLEIIENYFKNTNNLIDLSISKKIMKLIKLDKILEKKYNVVVTNPPYMGNRNMTSILSDYAKKNYPNSKLDMSTMFMEKCEEFLLEDGYISMINIPVWLNISKYEKLRYSLFNKVHIINLLYFGRGIFGSDFGSTAFVLRKGDNKEFICKYLELFKTAGKVDSVEEKEKMFFERKKEFNVSLKELKTIPGFPISYSISSKMISCFSKYKCIKDYADVITGITTGDNDKFLKLWFEVEFKKIGFGYNNLNKLLSDNKKYIPYNKGGDNRKWYGNNEYVVDWTLKDKFNRPKTTMAHYYLKKGLTWSFFSFASFSLRYFDNGYLWDVIGSPMFPYEEKNIYKILGLLNSVVGNEFLKIINPTVAFQAADIQKVPFCDDILLNDRIDYLVKENIKYLKDDWDSFEISWDFKKMPLLNYSENLLKNCIEKYKKDLKQKYDIVYNYETELNSIYLDIYNLIDELDNFIDTRFFNLRLLNYEREIKSLISYAVGCMFGRYSLDENGLVYAGGEFDVNRYKTFKVDIDNVIPITDEAYFADDIVSRFKTFIEVVYGKETLNENLDYIAETLGKRGTETSEDSIRRYFNNDFYLDHIKMYQKKPIYWLFDSGKKNGFKCLIYMHRYNENLVPKVRLDYLHRIQTTYEKLLSDINYKLTTELSMNDKKETKKRQAELNAKLQEIKEYDEKIAHIANQRISIDLDDGVSVNYGKFADILGKIK